MKQGKGWHLESARHSTARRYGSAGGKMPKRKTNSKKSIFSFSNIFKTIKKDWKEYNTPRKSTKEAIRKAKNLKEGEPYPKGHKYYGLVKGDEDTGAF